MGQSEFSLSLGFARRVSSPIPNRHETRGFDRTKRDPSALHSSPRMAHAHMNDSHAGSLDLGCTGSKLDSAQKARRDSAIRGKFLQTVTSRTDTKRMVAIVLSAIVPTFSYASVSAHAHERLARQQLRLMSREKHIWLVRPVRSLGLRVFLRCTGFPGQ